MGLLKLGAVVFFAYTVGGSVGMAIVTRVSDHPTDDKIAGAKWAGRAVAFVALGYLASKI